MKQIQVLAWNILCIYLGESRIRRLTFPRKSILNKWFLTTPTAVAITVRHGVTKGLTIGDPHTVPDVKDVKVSGQSARSAWALRGAHAGG